MTEPADPPQPDADAAVVRPAEDPVPPALDTPPESPPSHETATVPWGQPPPTPVTEGTAVLALVLAILSWVLLPVVLAIVALVLAGSAARQIAGSGGAKSGLGLVTAARWIAWINLLLAAMVVAFVAAFAVAIAIAS